MTGWMRKGQVLIPVKVRILGSTMASLNEATVLREMRLATMDLRSSLLPLPDVPAMSPWQVTGLES
jgi:hypothetical protein